MEINNYEDDRRFSVQGYCISDKDFQINQNNFLKGIYFNLFKLYIIGISQI